MSVSGSLQHIFENPSLPENPNLPKSLSWNQIKPPVKSIHSFTDIFGELHFKENHNNNNNEYVSNTTPTTASTTQPRNVHLCTEGLGFESSDDVEDCKNNEVNSDEREKECYENKKSLGLEDWCEWRTRSSIRVYNKKKNDGVEYPPPISSIGRSGKPCVSFMSYRDNGRFVLKEVMIPIQEFLHAHREDGRLKLHFVQPDEDDDDGDCCNHEEEEEDYDEVESVVEEEHMGKENDDESVIDIK